MGNKKDYRNNKNEGVVNACESLREPRLGDNLPLTPKARRKARMDAIEAEYLDTYVKPLRKKKTKIDK
ncbi:MAG: hypothetical protein DRP45_04870 [Candidatus Zixiibacteriota bacterium]|nr:MAG: hypothetical protein DRP45_04870 [candidate division Zixibacteria bacterium]